MSELALLLERARERPLAGSERLALRRLRREARAHGVTLKRAGRGRLAPSLVLGVLRRDGWRCKVHGDAGQGTYGGLEVHHKAHLEAPSERLAAMKNARGPAVLVTVCAKAHDEIHERDRAEARTTG